MPLGKGNRVRKAFFDAVFRLSRGVPAVLRDLFIRCDIAEFRDHVVKEKASRPLLRYRREAKENSLKVSLLQGRNQLDFRFGLFGLCRRTRGRGWVRAALGVFRIAADAVFLNLQICTERLLAGGVDAADGVGGDAHQGHDRRRDQDGSEKCFPSDFLLSHGLDLLCFPVHHGEIAIVDSGQSPVELRSVHTVIPSSVSCLFNRSRVFVSRYLTFPSGRSYCAATSLSVCA